MSLIITTQDALEDLVRSSMKESLKDFYEKQKKAENSQVNLTIKEAARFLNVSDLTVRNYIKRGDIKARRIGNRLIIKKEQLENALKEVKSLKYKR